MRIDWTTFRPRITVTGMAAWVPGQRFGWRGALHDHGVLFFTAGTGQMRPSDGGITPLAAGTCLWLTPGRIYEASQEPADSMRNGYIHFELLNAAGEVRGYDQPVPPMRIENIDTGAVEATFRRVTTLLPYFSADHRGRVPPERLAVAESLLTGLLMDLDLASQDRQPEAPFGLQRHHSETILRVLMEIEDQHDAPRTVESMADSAGYSPAHFSRVFRAVMGQWPEQFMIERRIERAKVLLTTTAMTIAEIADRLGYRQTSFFSTQFSRKVGCSPRVFRDRRRREHELKTAQAG